MFVALAMLLSAKHAIAESIETADLLLKLPNDIKWQREDFGAGSPQTVAYDGGTTTTFTRSAAKDLFASVDRSRLQTYDLWLISLDVSGVFPSAAQHLKAVKDAPQSKTDTLLETPTFEQVKIDGHDCVRTTAASRFFGTTKFPDKVFDLHLVRHECFLPEVKKLVRIEFSERLLAGQQSSAREFIDARLGDLTFRTKAR